MVWDSTTSDSITWAHAPNCTDQSSCILPTVFNAECLPPEVELAEASAPTCGGCLPLCSIDVSKWQMPAGVGACEDAVISLRVTNNSTTDPLTVSFYWQPCGSTDICDREGELLVSGLPASSTVVSDSITGRPYIDASGIKQRQVGIVSTPSGAPWTPLTLDTLNCWELVAQAAPGADFTVVVERRERDS